MRCNTAVRATSTTCTSCRIGSLSTYHRTTPALAAQFVPILVPRYPMYCLYVQWMVLRFVAQTNIDERVECPASSLPTIRTIVYNIQCILYDVYYIMYIRLSRCWYNLGGLRNEPEYHQEPRHQQVNTKQPTATDMALLLASNVPQHTQPCH